MKVKTLIKELQKHDSELEVCVGNIDIHFIAQEPAYWDGCFEVLERDKSKDPYFNIVGAKFVEKGEKVRIRILSIRDIIWNDPNIPVECFNEEQEKMVAKWRQEVRDFDKELNK